MSTSDADDDTLLPHLRANSEQGTLAAAPSTVAHTHPQATTNPPDFPSSPRARTLNSSNPCELNPIRAMCSSASRSVVLRVDRSQRLHTPPFRESGISSPVLGGGYGRVFLSIECMGGKSGKRQENETRRARPATYPYWTNSWTVPPYPQNSLTPQIRPIPTPV